MDTDNSTELLSPADPTKEDCTGEDEDETTAGVEIFTESNTPIEQDIDFVVEPNLDLEALLSGMDVGSGKKSRSPILSEGGEDDEWTLDTLPFEILLKIFSFIEAGHLLRTVSFVCKRFHLILSNETTWKIRQTKRWFKNGIYPPVPPVDEEFRWSVACLKREEQIKLWVNGDMNLRRVELASHIACIDAVHLFNGAEFLVSGGRDRAMNIYNVEKCFEPTTGFAPGLVLQKSGAHSGWIWSFATSPSFLCSGSWDTTLKLWDRNCNFDHVQEYRTPSACLCISAMENLIAIGTFDRKVVLYDPRVKNESVNLYVTHKKSVLKIGVDENCVVSCGEDGRIARYDLKAGKVQKIIQLQRPSYATSLSFHRQDPSNLYYFGDKLGNLYLIDSHRFTLVKKYPSIHTRTVQGVFHGLGSVITCSSDGQMKVFEPSSGLNELSSFRVSDGIELTDVHSLCNYVALAGGDGVLRIWAPVGGFYI